MNCIPVCVTRWMRVIPDLGPLELRRWIPYTAAQVAARRAAQMVAITTCITVCTPSVANGPLPPMPPLPRNWYEPVPDGFVPPTILPPVGYRSRLNPTNVPEPTSTGLFLAGLIGLYVARKVNTQHKEKKENDRRMPT